MKNENIIVKFTAFVLLLTMIVLCLVSGTFAKYTSSFAGEDTAIVARWDVADGDIEERFDIFDKSKIYDTNGVDFENPVADTDVFQDIPQDGGESTEDSRIAPGTWGSFTYELTNGSDVSVAYEVLYTADEAGIPLEWSLDASNWVTDVDELNVEETRFENSEEEITLYWRWVFENGETTDEEDTTLGTAETLATPSIKIDVTFTQID